MANAGADRYQESFLRVCGQQPIVYVYLSEEIGGLTVKGYRPLAAVPPKNSTAVPPEPKKLRGHMPTHNFAKKCI